jgi:hypothetical protein
MTNLIEFEPRCIYPPCGVIIPEYTDSGRKKPPHRRREQKFCCPSCARLHNSEQVAANEAKVAAGQLVQSNFIYGAYTDDGITKESITRQATAIERRKFNPMQQGGRRDSIRPKTARAAS